MGLNIVNKLKNSYFQKKKNHTCKCVTKQYILVEDNLFKQKITNVYKALFFWYEGILLSDRLKKSLGLFIHLKVYNWQAKVAIFWPLRA